MLHNRFAGDALKKVDILYQGGIEMNGQIVLCRGINDGEETGEKYPGSGKVSPAFKKRPLLCRWALQSTEKGCAPWNHLQKKMR